MTHASDRQHDRIIDSYLASHPILRPTADAASSVKPESRYTSQDRDRILSSIFNEVSAVTGSPSSQQTLNLFGVEDSGESSPSAVARPSAYFDRVIRAYFEVYDGYSIDRLIADRDRNSLFISRCWSLGVQASARELNWSLLNARKANQVGPVPGVARFVMPAADMYQFLFASEIALRHVQDAEWTTNQRSVSLDLILCDPDLSDRFETIAKQLAPGHSVFEYRWAAMCIRKNQRRSVKSRMPRFEDLGRTSDLRPSMLSDRMGFYWFQSGAKPLYVGHAQNLRVQVDRIMQQGGSTRVFPDWMLEGTSEPVRLAVAPTKLTALSKRETLKSEVCLSHSPLFNAVAASHSDPDDNRRSGHRRCA